MRGGARAGARGEMKVADEKFTFSLGASGDATVDGWEDLLLWLAKERAKWSWLVPGEGATDSHGWASNVHNQWTAMVNNTSAVRSQGQRIIEARTQLRPLASGPLIASETPDGQLVLEILESAGEAAAAFAYAFIKGAVTAGS